MTRSTLNTAASLAALALAGLAQAACGNNTSAVLTEPAQTSSVSPALSQSAARKAQDFIDKAAQANLVEIRTSEMALDKSANPDVKAFAQQMIDQHKAALDKVKAAAQAGSLMAPADVLDDFHMRRVNDLTETDGDADFDADYAALQVDAHNDAIRLFEDYQKDAEASASLKELAGDMLPVLTAHKAEAEKLRASVTKTPGSANPS